MAITISTEKTKELLARLIRADFEKIDFEMEYIYRRADELIALATAYGLHDEAKEMTNCKNVA